MHDGDVVRGTHRLRENVFHARSFEDGAIREAFRTLRPRGERKPMRAFSLVEVEGEEEAGEDVDLIALAKEYRHEPR